MITSQKLETLLQTALAGVADTEVVVSRVAMPPGASLPKHWHPGEEFAYILDGSVTLWQDGEDDITCRTGDALMVPLRKIHTIHVGEEGCEMIVFRVHEAGQPERILIEE